MTSAAPPRTAAERLEAHIEHLRQQRRGEQEQSATGTPQHLPCVQSPQQQQLPPPGLEAFGVSPGYVGLSRMPLTPGQANERYDQLVKDVVRRAWNTAWKDYQSGSWCGSRGAASSNGQSGDESAAAGASGAGEGDEAAAADPVPGLVRAASSSSGNLLPLASATTTMAAAARTAPQYDPVLSDQHPHLPASNRREPMGYGAAASRRRGGRGPGR